MPSRDRPTLRGLVEEEVSPGPATGDGAPLADHIRRTASNYYHVAGTCRMGEESSGAVTDTQLRVIGMRGLRVADASVMPSLVNGNTNAAVMMIAERAAEMMAAG